MEEHHYIQPSGGRGEPVACEHTILDIIVPSKSSPYVVNFYHTISQAQLGNGRYILEEVALLTNPRRGAEEHMEKAEIEKAVLFRIGMPMAEATSEVYDYIAMFERLSKSTATMSMRSKICSSTSSRS